ncbi:permease prefix domain 1-containing protein [Robertmurraya massiliosenegalensis]|uniref:permease prefix domain 1-containing protein n=1 Tax=Robertmurraya TaxID=2837507 RepID=UPI0039A66E59
MNTIIDYVNNLFATLPKTAQLETIKEEMLSNMEDKYNELKRSGKSENEAIGIVISEFGNIDELLSELEIQFEEKKDNFPLLSEEEVETFLETSKKSNKLIGFGVTLCMLGAALLILFLQLPNLSEVAATSIGVTVLLVLVAIAVGLFIYAAMMKEKYKFIEEKGEFSLSFNARQTLENKSNAFQSTFTLSIIFGVILCILSPVSLFITLAINEDSTSYGVVALLLMAAIAINIFIYYGGIKDSYNRLLKLAEYSERQKEENKVVGAVAVIVWPLAVCIFLVTGLVYEQWHINWIIFPITGILFGMFSGAYNILKDRK